MIVSADRIHRVVCMYHANDGTLADEDDPCVCALYVAVPGVDVLMKYDDGTSETLPGAQIPSDWLALDRPCDTWVPYRPGSSVIDACPDCFNGRHTFTLEVECGECKGTRTVVRGGSYFDCSACIDYAASDIFRREPTGMVRHTVSVARRSDDWPGGFVQITDDNHGDDHVVSTWYGGTAQPRVVWRDRPDDRFTLLPPLPPAARPGDHLVRLDTHPATEATQ